MKRVLKWVSLAILLTVIAALVLLWTPNTDPATMRSKYGGAPSQFVDVGGGLTVHLRDEGPRDAPVIVLLHGSNSDLHTWDAWTRSLIIKYRVIRFDQIGHGLTGPSPTRDYGPAAMVATTDRVANVLGLSTFTLAGNSMGGGIAWRYAVSHPDRLDGLVLIDATGAPDLRKQSLPLGFRIARTPGLRDVMLYVTPRSLIDKSLHQSVSNQAIVTDAAVDRYWELLRYPGNRQATIDRFAQPSTVNDAARVVGIKVPTLILWGDDDKLLPVSGAKWFATNIPGSQIITYPGIGHLPMEETADKSVNDMMNWLATITPAR
jgi:pimeloyl-ACP methyl ester carboxylesterase